MDISHNIEKSKIEWVEGSNSKKFFNKIKEIIG